MSTLTMIVMGQENTESRYNNKLFQLTNKQLSFYKHTIFIFGLISNAQYQHYIRADKYLKEIDEFGNKAFTELNYAVKHLDIKSAGL
jgi:hypothetical protein